MLCGALWFMTDMMEHEGRICATLCMPSRLCQQWLSCVSHCQGCVVTNRFSSLPLNTGGHVE